MKTPAIRFHHIAALAKLLGKPISIFDLEATGFRGPAFGITEVAVFTVMEDGSNFLYGSLINPENPITAQASAVTGITQRMVARQENWGVRYAQSFDKMSREHVMCGFNSKTFDNPAVIEQNLRYGVQTAPFSSVVDVRQLYLKAAEVKGQRGKLIEVAALYGIFPQGNLHRATADVVLTVELLNAILEKHGPAIFLQLAAGKDQRDGECALYDKLSAMLPSIGSVTIDALATSLGVSVQDMDFPLCKAVDAGLVDARLFAHPPTRSWLNKAIPMVLANGFPFDGKLKPLFEILKAYQPTGASLTYLQLRIGLLDLGYLAGNLKQNSVREPA